MVYDEKQVEVYEEHFNKYSKYFSDERRFLQIIKKILVNRGEERRTFTKIFKLLRHHWLNYSKTPHLDDLFLEQPVYKEKSKVVMESNLRSLHLLDQQGYFTAESFNEYLSLYEARSKSKREIACARKDIGVNPDVDIDLAFEYGKTMETIRDNPSDISFHFPDTLQDSAKKLDYSNTDLQIIKLNHIGGNPRTPIPLTYHYHCAGCGNECNLTYLTKELICDDEMCGRKMKHIPAKDTFIAGYASQVVTNDFNNIPILSLVKIPTGEFNAAVFLRNNKSGYYLFMISVEDIMVKSSDIPLNENEHAIWQVIRHIDGIHKKRMGKHIIGMEWYKAAIVLSHLANLQGYTSMNVLAYGQGGTGKTSIPRFYLATMTHHFKRQDALSVSSAGLYGSTVDIKVGDTTIRILELGLLARERGVVIDEVYIDHQNKILPVLRSLLRESTIPKEVAGNRMLTVKNACVIGTSNPAPSVLLAQSQWIDRWIANWVREQRKDDLDDSVTDLITAIAHAHMIEEWVKRDLDWHTGQQFPDLDRWMLLFFIQKKETRLKEHHLNPIDSKIDDMQMSKMFYDQSTHDYLLLCSQTKVDYSKYIEKILDFIEELRKHDTIHTDRIGGDVTLLLTLSAQINGRAELTDDDFSFVRELYSKTCTWIDVDDLAYDPATHTYTPQDWTIEKIKAYTHSRMNCFKGSKRYYMTHTGFSLISGELENRGAPTALVDDTIAHYKDNPYQ